MKMKRIVPVLIFVISCIFTYGQNSEVNKMLQEIEGQWSLDDNGNVTYQRIVEATEIKKDEIYNRVLNYFVYNYGSGKSVIQSQDKENGEIIGKGLYDKVFKFSNGFGFIYMSTYHILRVNVKDGRARIILTLTDYSEFFNGGGSGAPSTSTLTVTQQFPFNKEGDRKNNMGKAFYYSHKRAVASLAAIEKAIKEGNTSKQLENSEW